MSTPDKSSCQQKECEYYRSSAGFLANRYGFIVCISAVIVLAIVFFMRYNIQYDRSQEEIMSAHREMMSLLKADSMLAPTDSVVVYKDFSVVLDEHIKAIDDGFRLERERTESNYTLLTIWASVLMIVFLIFSIYSMFKIDELQRQGRESLQNIDNLHASARSQSKRLQSEVDGALGKIDEKIEEEVNKIKEKIQDSIAEFDAKMKTYQEELEKSQKGTPHQKLLQALQDLVSSSTEKQTEEESKESGNS